MCRDGCTFYLGGGVGEELFVKLRNLAVIRQRRGKEGEGQQEPTSSKSTVD